MISIKIKGDFLKTQGQLENINNDIKTGNFLKRLALLLNSSIQQRVQRFGIGDNGQKMSPYSRLWREFRASKGRKTEFRDLTFTGKMWQSLTAAKAGKDVKMYFGNAEQADKARDNEKRTPFFGLSDREKKVIKNELKNFIKNGNQFK